MNYKFILAIDPSGSFHEGKGTTGWCVMNCLENKITICDSIFAGKYKLQESYWHRHLDVIDEYSKRYGDDLIVVIEDYLLYAGRADSQINSRMETCKLIGILQHHCWSKHIPYFMQTAMEVKNRWDDPILLHKGYIVHKGKGFALPNKIAINRHCKDAVRHAVHFYTFRNGAKKI